MSYYYEKSCKPSTEEQHSLPRKRKRLNYSSLQYIEGHQSAEDRYSVTVKNHYRSIYYEASDAIAQAFVTRFDQPNFKAQCFLEQLLLTRIQDHVITIDFFGIKNIYGDDINMDSLPTEFQVLKTIAK